MNTSKLTKSNYQNDQNSILDSYLNGQLPIENISEQINSNKILETKMLREEYSKVLKQIKVNQE